MSHSTLPFIRPLDEFYRRQGRPLPAFAVVAPGALPEPARTLLMHERDMTRTLEQYHQGRIHLRVLSSHRTADAYWRESVLELDGTNSPVEFGAIKIVLDAFPEPWRSQILEEHRPLGGILNASGIAYTSRPTAYLRFESDDFISRAFGMETPPPSPGAVLAARSNADTLESHVALYGRQNTLRGPRDEVLAEIIEILPP
jgi:hypothetical protein